MGEERQPVSGKRVLLVLAAIAVVMQLLLMLFILDVRRRKPATIIPAPQPATTAAVSNQPG